MFRKNLYRGERVRHRSADFASDPGDLGRGRYFSSSIHYARAYGPVRKHRIRLRNPAYLSVEDIYAYGYQFKTIHGKPVERLAAAHAMTEHFKSMGHDGIVAKGYECGPDTLTVVVF